MYQLNKCKCWLTIGVGLLFMHSAAAFAHSNHRTVIHIELGSHFHHYHKPPRVIHRHHTRHGHRYRHIPPRYRHDNHRYRMIHRDRH